MATPDLTVMGAGIFGLSIAWEAARRGARVRVIETAGIGAGSSGGYVGALAPHVPEGWTPAKEFQFEALVAAEAFWREVARCSGTDPHYARTGRLMPLADADAVARARLRGEGARRLWRGLADWIVIPVGEAGPFAPVSPSGLVVRETLAARIAPRWALAALVAALRERGGEIVVGAGEPAGPVVWATGAQGLADLSAWLGVEAGGGLKGQAALLAFDAAGAPQVYAGGVHVVPHGDGTVAVGSTSERSWADPGSTDDQLDRVIAQARAACPWLEGAPVIGRWAGVRPRPSTRAPLLGAWPGRAGHFVANGGFKIGFGLAPGVAAVMADLVLDGRDAVPPGLRVEELAEGRRT